MSTFASFRWNFVIGTTDSIMSRFVLKLKNNSEADRKRFSLVNKSFGRFTRNFTSIHVNMDGTEGFDEVAKLLTHFGPTLRELKIICPNVPILVGGSLMRQVLQTLPHLITLHMFKVAITPEGIDESSEPIPMAQLQELKLGLRSWRLIKIISAPQLKSFDSLSIDSFQTEEIVHLLKALKPSLLFSYRGNLENFYYHCSKNEAPAAALRLEKFEVGNGFKVRDAASFEMFESFLRTQNDSLSRFKCCCMNGHYNPRGLYKITFMELNALTTLTLDFSLLPVECEFYDQLKPLRSLKEINVEGSFLSISAAKRFLKLCPSLTYLFAINDEIIPKLLKFISIYNPSIERMLLNSIPKGNISKMPSLKRVDLKFNGDGFEEFQEINPHVKLGESMAPRLIAMTRLVFP